MRGQGLVEWGFLLVTLSNVLLIALVLTLLWQRLFPKGMESTSQTPDTAPALSLNGHGQDAANLIENAHQQDVMPLGQAMNDSLDLVGGLDELDGTSYPDWKKTNQAQIDELLASRESLEFKLSDLKSKLDRAHKLVNNLHTQNREMKGADMKLKRLAMVHQRTQVQLAEARSERDGLRVTVDGQARELADLRRRLAASSPVPVEASEVDEEVQHELENLRETLEEERAKLSRTLVEKEFIEQVYIDTDAVTDDYQTLQREHAALQEQLRVLQARLESVQLA